VAIPFDLDAWYTTSTLKFKFKDLKIQYNAYATAHLPPKKIPGEVEQLRRELEVAKNSIPTSEACQGIIDYVMGHQKKDELVVSTFKWAGKAAD
jgi:hypothetical protein